MRATIEEHYSGRTRIFEGPPEEVAGDLRAAYPDLHRFGMRVSPEILVADLNSSQAYSASISEPDLIFKSEAPGGVLGSMTGADSEFDAAHDAALSMAHWVDEGSTIHQPTAAAKRMYPGDPRGAALASFGLPTTPEVRATLEMVMECRRPIPAARDPEPVTFSDVKPVIPDGEPFAAAVRRASSTRNIKPIHLGGKHSQGTLLAEDPEEHIRLILKPGHGQQNPAAGDTESGSSQAKREAAFYDASGIFGLQLVVPEARLLLLDGTEYAAIKMVGYRFQDVNKMEASDPGKAERVFAMHRPRGDLHRWAAMDYILGQVDRNGGNVMIGDPTEVRLIDAGSAFAGSGFDPAADPATFIPCYLRYTNLKGFQEMSSAEKMRAMPRIDGETAAGIGKWLLGVDINALAAALQTYGIETGPAMTRLVKLKDACSTTRPDIAINAAWVLP